MITTQTPTIEIQVNEVTRVEGHGNISVRLEDGEITKLELQIVESPRFFESFLRGRAWHEAPLIACRICGICSVGHTTAAVKAIEAACDIAPTHQTVTLRKLILMGELLQSHVLHLYFLAVPDYLGVGSVIPLAKSHPDVVRRALRMKRLANDLCQIVGGRHIHPISYRVGGFTHVPSLDELREMRTRLEAFRGDVDATAELLRLLVIPKFERPTSYLSLQSDDGEYSFYDGTLKWSDSGSRLPASRYRERVLESVVGHSTAKHCRLPSGLTYAVGALARYNNSASRLHPRAKQAAAQLGLHGLCMNPYHNNTAQFAEIVHCTEVAIELIDELLHVGVKPEPLAAPKRFARGVGAVEVPRGVLFHEFSLDAAGRVECANLVIPTGQNLANIEEDLRTLVPRLVQQRLTREEITHRLEMLVRAYDPCISCATHVLDVEWL